MGLTIHYRLTTELTNPKEVRQLVETIRQHALDLPFKTVGDVKEFTGAETDFRNGEEEDRWLKIQSSGYVAAGRGMLAVAPLDVIALPTWPGDGCEPANFGFCKYPVFFPSPTNGKRVPTRLSGWRWTSFCKTQYASDPQAGGIPNFLRCHISVITLLDRMAKLPGLKVQVDDEGKYGPSTFSDDWKEAHEAGRKPTYRRHKGRRSPVALANEVGEWNTMIAGMTGALSDALVGSGVDLESPIKGFPDFEQLEFAGRNQKHLAPFLQAMKKLANANVGDPALCGASQQ